MRDICDRLAEKWPDNRTVNLVSHGHSVPAGYFATPYVDSFHAYPHLLHRHVKERFPFAVVNMIVTAVGGENSAEGAKRFERDVLPHRPDVLLLDYGLNDRGIGLAAAEAAWRGMIERVLTAGAKVILLTPSWDQGYFSQNSSWQLLAEHARQIRTLAEVYQVGLADAFAAFERYIDRGGALQDLLSHVNHPNHLGHQLIAEQLSRWFIAR